MDSFHLIDILDEQGQVIGQKKRGEIDRFADILPSAFVLLVTSKARILIVKIADGSLPKNLLVTSKARILIVKIADGSLPKNPFAGLWGCSAATFVRSGEAAITAAERALYSDLGIMGELIPLSEEMVTWPNGMKRKASLFTCQYDKEDFEPRKEAVESWKLMTQSSVENAMRLNPQDFAPSFVSFYEKHHRRLF
jgi:hypothetical protein